MRSGGWLGSHIDEERSKLRNVIRIAELVNHQIFERLLHLWVILRVCLFQRTPIKNTFLIFCAFCFIATSAADGCFFREEIFFISTIESNKDIFFCFFNVELWNEYLKRSPEILWVVFRLSFLILCCVENWASWSLQRTSWISECRLCG